MIWLQIILFLAIIAALMWYMLSVTVRHKGIAAEKCGGCGYSLVGIEDPPCPECGRDRRLDDPQRQTAGKIDTAGTVSHIVSVAVAASIVGLFASAYLPIKVSAEQHGVIGVAHANQPTVLFSRFSEGWQLPHRDYWHEPQRILFELDNKRIELVRDPRSSGWLESGGAGRVEALDVMAALGVGGVETAINNVLNLRWGGGFHGPAHQRSLAAGQAYAEIRQTHAGGGSSSLPLLGLLLIVWVLAGWRIWSLFR